MNANNILQLIEQAEVEWKPLGEVATLYGGLTGKSKNDFESGNAKYITYKNIFGNLEIDCTTLESVKISENEKQHCVQYGDVLFTGSSEISEEAGMSAAVTTHFDEPIYLNSFSFGIRFNEYIDIAPEFAKFLFRSNFMRKQIIKTASGVTRFNISKEQFKKIQIPIPPISLQKEIVNILDKLTELKATLKAELSLREKQYQYYRDYLLTFGDDVEWESLGEVVDIYLGLTYKPTYVENGVKFISAQNTSCDFLDLSDVKYISEQEYEKVTDNAKPKKGDVLFTRVGSNLGHPVIVETDERLCIFVSLGFLRVKDKSILLNSYLKYWMNTDLFWDQVNKNVHGSAKVNLNTGWLKKFKIPIPPLETQAKIVAILDKFETLTRSITEGLPKEIELRDKQYQYYRDKLLNFNKKKM